MTTTAAKKKASPAPSKKVAKTAVKASQAVNKPAAPVPTKAVTAKPAPVTAPKTDKKKEKTEKVKVVRDSFTIPKNEFAQIAEMKKKAMGLGIDIKKSELIRAGLLLLTAMSDAAFKKALANVPTLKTGRPGKS